MAADETWRTDEIEDLFSTILRLQTVPEAEHFFRDLCTLGELRDMAQRWAVVRMLDEGLHYAEISQRTGASTATITRIASWLRHGEGGYRLMLDRLTTGAQRQVGPKRPPGSPRPAGAAPAGGAAATSGGATTTARRPERAR